MLFLNLSFIFFNIGFFLTEKWTTMTLFISFDEPKSCARVKEDYDKASS